MTEKDLKRYEEIFGQLENSKENLAMCGGELLVEIRKLNNVIDSLFVLIDTLKK